MMALPKYQLNWVADHLGHNLEIHRKYYRQPIDSVETAKITKLMYLVDHCKMQHVQGMDLDTVDEYLSKDNMFNGNTGIEDYEETNQHIEDNPDDVEIENSLGDNDDVDATPFVSLPNCRADSSSQAHAGKRSYWPLDQERRVEELFRSEIAQRRCPNKEKCISLLHEFPHCNGAYRTLVAKVNNIVTKAKGRKTPVRKNPAKRRKKDSEAEVQDNDELSGSGSELSE